MTEYCSLDQGETAIGVLSLTTGAPTIAIGTAQGVVKRLSDDVPVGRDIWPVIALRPGDQVVGSAETDDDHDLVFVTSDAQLLRFAAAGVRPQGRAAAGMTGIKPGVGAQAVFFGSVAKSTEADSIVVTVAGSLGQLAGTSASSIKISAWSEFPRKGRATGGVRCHRLVKGEDAVLLAWAGPTPVRAETAAGKPVRVPDHIRPRDASGDKLSTPAVTALGGSHW